MYDLSQRQTQRLTHRRSWFALTLEIIYIAAILNGEVIYCPLVYAAERLVLNE